MYLVAAPVATGLIAARPGRALFVYMYDEWLPSACKPK